MDEFSPKSYLEEVENDLVCYDLEFGCGGAAHKGYEFQHSSGLCLTIDVDANGLPLAMTLIHKKGTAKYEITNSYADFVTEAKKVYEFAHAIIAFVKVQEAVQVRRQELEDIRSKMQNELIEMVRRVEQFGSSGHPIVTVTAL